jgi:hypothetical protein
MTTNPKKTYSMQSNRLNLAGGAFMAFLVAFIASQANGQSLGKYSFTGANNGDLSGFTVESPAPNVSFSTLGNTGLTGVGVMSAFSATTEAPLSNNGNPPYPFDGKGFEATYSNIRASTDPDASNDFLQFSVAPAAGHRLTINNVRIDVGTDFTTTFNPEVRYNLWYSLDNVIYYKIGDTSPVESNSNAYRIRNDVTKAFVANGAAIPTGTETIYFRLAFGLVSASGVTTKKLFVDDIVVNGTSTLIPDPVLELDLVNTNEVDFNFGNVFGSESRKMTFVCKSAGGLGTVNIDTIAVTNNAGGLFTLGTVTWSNTGNQPLLSAGDSVTIEVVANNSLSGTFAGQLTIDTTSAGGSSAADSNDLVLPLNSTTIANQALLNQNPLMAGSLSGWSGNAAFVTPGIAPGSPGMARVRGKGDPAGTVQGSLYQTAVPNGFSDFQFITYFTPIDVANFVKYADPEGVLNVTGPEGRFTDRTFQWVLLGSDDSPPNPVFGATQAANTLINLAYLPDGDSTGGTPDFYVFDGVADSWVATGIGAIAGSVDNDTDGNALNGVGDGLLNTAVDPLDVINVYKLVVTGTGLGTPSASYNVSVTKVSGPDTFTSGSASSLTRFHGLDGTANTATGHAFITSDTSGSNSQNGFRTPFWVDDTAIFNGTAPDPSLTLLNTPGFILVNPPATTGSTSFIIRNDGTATNLEVTSITTGTGGFTVTSPGSFSLAPSATAQIDVQWNSANSAYTPSYETAQLTINTSSLPPVVLNLGAGVLVNYPQALSNGSFETPGTDNVGDTDTFADWNEAPGSGTPDPTKVTDVPGLIAPSITAAAIAPSNTTSPGRLGQDLTSPPLVNFTLDFDFAVPKVGRDLYFLLETAGSSGRTNIGYNSTANTFIAFDQVTNGFINILPIDLTAGTPYKLRVTGTNWGFANWSTTLEVFNSSGASLGLSAPFAYFQYTRPVGGLVNIEFTTEFGGSGGVTLDEVSISGQGIDTSPPPSPAELRLDNPVFVPGSPNQFLADVVGGAVDVYRSTTLEPGSWTGPIVAGVGPGTGLLIDANATLPKAFYLAVPSGGAAP